MRSIPSITALTAFERAAKLGSFKEAAACLGLSTSAISHQIRSLEKDLSVTFFTRHGNGVVPTETALQYLRVIETALSQLERGTAEIRKDNRKRELKISLLSSFSVLWLIPRLPDFYRDYPDINIVLLENGSIIDFNSSSADAAIRYDYFDDSSWDSLAICPLLEEHCLPVCSPQYANAHKNLSDANWFYKHKLLVNKRHENEWDSWFSTQNINFDARKDGSLTFMDTSIMTLTAAANGLGVAIGRTPFIDQLLLDRKLVCINDRTQKRGMRNYLVYPTSLEINEDFSKFRHWLQKQADVCNNSYNHLLKPPETSSALPSC